MSATTIMNVSFAVGVASFVVAGFMVHTVLGLCVLGVVSMAVAKAALELKQESKNKEGKP